MKPARHDDNVSTIRYAVGETLLGEAMVFLTTRGVCALRLLDGATSADLLRDMGKAVPGASFQQDDAAGKRAFRQVGQWLAGKLQPEQLTLDLHGTPFQQRVWQELLRVGHGQTCTYSELADRVGRPRAVRAVASACARNPVGLLVPCHRILAKDGSLGGYYWGLEKKQQLLDHELATAARAR
jgi:AraC family transcriptional regulator, regulatory protein of adaptative response / methylated-DNA-[protein]-cysteine methyltransferase